MIFIMISSSVGVLLTFEALCGDEVTLQILFALKFLAEVTSSAVLRKKSDPDQ